MAQAWTDSQEKLLREDPLSCVKDEIQHSSLHLRHVDVPKEDVQMGEDDVVKSHVPEAFVDELKNGHGMVEGVRNLGGTESEFMEDDPLHNVKQELEHRSPCLKHVESPYSPGHRPSGAGNVVKADVPPAFEEELKNDHDIVEGATNLGGTEAEFMEDDPLHNVKQELEHRSPHLKHVESPYFPGHRSSDAGDVVKADVPPAFEEELKNDHDIVKSQEENQVVTRDLRDPGLLRGRPRHRMSANVGISQGGSTDPETANMCVKDEADEEDEASNEVTPQESSSLLNEETNAFKLLPRSGMPARGTPHFRISAHQGMRPGGPLSRDLKAESTESFGGDGAGADLSGETKPKGSGLRRGGAPSGPNRGGLSSSGSRRGGLARTGSGVPGEQKVGGGSLARTGSGVPGEQRAGGGSLARTGSGVLGNSLARQGSGAFGGLARTGSGIPSTKGGNDLGDFTSFLNSADFMKDETQSPGVEDESGDHKKGVLGKIGDKLNQLNSYAPPYGPLRDGDVSKNIDQETT